MKGGGGVRLFSVCAIAFDQIGRTILTDLISGVVVVLRIRPPFPPLVQTCLKGPGLWAAFVAPVGAGRSKAAEPFCLQPFFLFCMAPSLGPHVSSCNGSSDSTQLYTDVIRISMILRCTLVQ